MGKTGEGGGVLWLVALGVWGGGSGDIRQIQGGNIATGKIPYNLSQFIHYWLEVVWCFDMLKVWREPHLSIKRCPILWFFGLVTDVQLIVGGDLWV